MQDHTMGDGTNPRVDRRTFLRATGTAGAAAALGGVASASEDDSEEILVGVSASASMAAVEREIPAEASVVRRNETLGYAVVELPEGTGLFTRMTVESRISNVEGVRYTEENATYYPHATPDDELFDQQYAPQQVNAPEAYDTSLGSTDVTVAVVDQGVMYDHPDLADRFGENKGRDFVDDDGDPYPEDPPSEYHGTHVAGIAAATTDNATGVAGMSNARLISCRALGTRGGSTQGIADAIEYAADQGADVINMSLGGGGFSETLKNAVSYALNNGALVLASAGNSGTEGVSYPAAYNECVAVSAVDENENFASFSQYGDKVGVTGPGVDVLSCWTEDQSQFGGKYNRISGTSMSCPAASGVAALGKAVDPDLSPDQLRQRLKETAVDIGLGPKEQGAGRVDAANIVSPGDGGGGGGGGTCGDATATDSMTGSLNGSQDGDTYTYAAQTTGPCEATFSLTGDQALDCDLYLTLDGRTPTTSDFDERSWNAGPDEQVTIGDTDIDAGSEFGILVDSYSGSGSYTLSIEEVGSGDGGGGGGGGGGNEAPTASFTATPTSPSPDESVTFDAAGSSDPDGSIASYEWEFGDGASGTGASATHAYTSPGQYAVTLTVTDGDGATDSTTRSVSVNNGGGGGGECGASSTTRSSSGTLSGSADTQEFSYSTETGSPCQVTVSLDGPSDADFDLLLTLDGRTPTPFDYDLSSVTQDSQERIVVDDVDSSTELGILVESWSGSGNFTLLIEELGN